MSRRRWRVPTGVVVAVGVMLYLMVAAGMFERLEKHNWPAAEQSCWKDGGQTYCSDGSANVMAGRIATSAAWPVALVFMAGAKVLG